MNCDLRHDTESLSVFETFKFTPCIKDDASDAILKLDLLLYRRNIDLKCATLFKVNSYKQHLYILTYLDY